MFLHNLWLCLHWHQSGLEMWAVPPCQGKYTRDAWGQRAVNQCSLTPHRNTIIQLYQRLFVKALVMGEASCKILDYFALVTAAHCDKLYTISLKNELEISWNNKFNSNRLQNVLIMGYYSGKKCHTAQHLSAIFLQGNWGMWFKTVEISLCES